MFGVAPERSQSIRWIFLLDWYGFAGGHCRHKALKLHIAQVIPDPMLMMPTFPVVQQSSTRMIAIQIILCIAVEALISMLASDIGTFSMPRCSLPLFHIRRAAGGQDGMGMSWFSPPEYVE
jgi:hypothetical protein